MQNNNDAKLSTTNEELASLFKTLGHPQRLAILRLLESQELCVCEIEAALDLRQAYISQQLTLLREAGLALATAVGATMQVIVLLVLFNRRIERLPWAQLLPSAGRTLAAALFMGALVLLADRYALPEVGNLIRLAILVATGAAAFLAAVWLLRCPELRELTRR